MTEHTGWTVISPVPDTAPTPTPPEGYTFEPVKDGDRLLGYIARYLKDGQPAERTLAWARNGTPESATWRWLPLPQPDPVEARAEPEQPPPAEQTTEGHTEVATAPADEPPYPFTLLGFSGDIYFYLGHGKRTVTALKANAHTAGNLYQLAPLSFWVRRWPSKRGFDSDSAASDLITLQHRIGVYDPSRLRGRGAYWDKKKNAALIHLGDSLLVDGQPKALHEHDGRYIYESQVPVEIDIDSPLRNAEAKELEKICDYLSWSNPVYGRLLAGWIVAAQICGALRWRPHVWIQGPHRSGKSTIVDHIVARALGKSAERFVGGVTEPGIRNTLKSDARPIVIDDLDSSTQRAREQVQAILGLMRVFTGEDGGNLVKGSQSGTPTSTRINACWIFCSIVIEADKPSDKSRVAELQMKPRTFASGQLEELHAKIDAALPDGFAARFYARCVRLIPAIRKNAETFAQAVGASTGDRRMGDLYGHLFACAYSLSSENLVTAEQAQKYVKEREIVAQLMQEQKQAIAENNEGERCLSHLLEHVITDTFDGRMMRASIFELIQSAGRGYAEGEHAEKLLRRNGIIPASGHFFVANDHSALRAIYEKSPWPTGWSGVIKTISGTESHSGSRFGARVVRAVKIPMSVIASAPKPPPAPPPPPDDDSIPI